MELSIVCRVRGVWVGWEGGEGEGVGASLTGGEEGVLSETGRERERVS